MDHCFPDPPGAAAMPSPAETILLEDCRPDSGGRPALHRANAGGRPVLYVHGATFPAAQSIFWRFGGWSWADALAAAGFEVWALDCVGFGAADRHPDQAAPPEGRPPVTRAPAAARQVASALRTIAARHGGRAASVIAHSWGTIPAALAAREPGAVDRLVLFGPIVSRPGKAAPPALGAWRPLTVAQQLARFVEDVPPGQGPLLLDPGLAAWGPAWLATDPGAAGRMPPAVATPNGPLADILEAWAGKAPYDPAAIRVPLLLARGAWDSLTTDADAAALLSRWGHPVAQDRRIPEGTHLLHLERNREALIAASIAFLKDTP